MFIDIILLFVTATAAAVAARCYTLLCRRDMQVFRLEADLKQSQDELERVYKRLRDEPAYDRRKQQ